VLIGACWPYLDQVAAPEETWTLARRLRPRALRICSNVAADELRTIVGRLPLERIVLRCKFPKLDSAGRRYRTGEARPDLLDYREWPSEPSLRDTLTLLAAEPIAVDLELLNEPDLEWDEPGSDQPERWPAGAADCAAYLDRQLAQLAAFRAEAGLCFRLVAPALSEGWPERHDTWVAALEPIMAACDALAIHAYVNGCA
jgi:hypothetical protein